MKILAECKNEDCKHRIIVANSARNFKNPALAVEKALRKGLIKRGQDILEIGAGNLRNLSFISRNVTRIRLIAFEVKATVSKFIDNYDSFMKCGGIIVHSFPTGQKYDAIICTFVLETICPNSKRINLLKNMRNSLKSTGILLGSFRGYSGVVGSAYQECPEKEGWLTPLHTFIKPFSIKETRSLLKSSDFSDINFFQDYRVDNPKNIHFLAR